MVGFAMGLLPIILVCISVETAAAQTVPPVVLSKISPSHFSDDELDLPYYLAHFHTVANSVVMEGPLRGFIDISVWRGPREQATHNARIMENILSLAFFYVTDRPWNPYFGHPAVRARLEAALGFWVRIQNDDGLFSETGPEVWGISPTAFGTKFMGETLRLLDGGPPIDAELLEEVTAATQAAILAVLTGDEFFDHGTRYSNHYTTVWGGALAYLSLHPDERLEGLLIQRIRQGLEEFQSPAGYFYERRGPDWVFELETHHSNHLAAWHFLRDTPLSDEYARAVQRSYEWLAYNAVQEPDGSGFTLNHSFETRLTRAFHGENVETSFGRTCLPISEVVVLARAFCESREERGARLDRRRAELERTWPDVPPLRVGEFYGYSPTAFLHRNHVQWHPSQDQKRAARALLPYVRSTRFTRRLADDRADFAVTFVRRPEYYAAFSAGERLDRNQRYGLGLVWLPEYGAILQSQKVDGTSWGTKVADADIVYEAVLENVRPRVEGRPESVRPGLTDLGNGTVSFTYPLGSRGEKTITFLPDEIVVRVRHDGQFVETVPVLLAPGDDLAVRAGAVEIPANVSISFTLGATPSTRVTNRRVGRKRLAVVELRARGELEYRLSF